MKAILQPANVRVLPIGRRTAAGADRRDQPGRGRRWSSVGLALLTAAACWTVQPTLRAQGTVTVTTLHSFNRTDGAYVGAGLVLGSDGNLYGTTEGDGTTNGGTLFAISTTGAFNLLYTFPLFGSTYDFLEPHASLLEVHPGVFYGTAATSNDKNSGGIFSITSGGGFAPVAPFVFDDNGGGRYPTAALIQGSDGNFYSTTQGGGTSNRGTVFRLTPGGALKILYSFSDNGDGAFPAGALVEGDDGNFYGTTQGKQSSSGNGYGTVFRITPDGTLTTLYSFGGGLDGGVPRAPLIQAGDGYLYGTTSVSGGSGTIFRITPAGTLKTLHRFSSSEGGGSNAALLEAGDGNFYGVTTGTNVTPGTIFSITPDGVVTTLYTFAANAGPDGALVQDEDGNFYGTTGSGGSAGYGAVFKLTVAGVPAGPGAGHPSFFRGETALGKGVYYLAFPNGDYFGYYSYLDNVRFIYHQDLGYEYVFDARDGQRGAYFYDFKSAGFFYSSPTFPFPYLYDFSLNTTLYYYPDPNNAGRYNTNGIRYFYRFDTGQIIVK